MKSFLSNLNQWIRRIHRWMVIPVVIILVANILSLGTPLGRTIQRIQQATVIFMVVTGVYLYLYRQWSILQRKKRTANKYT
ncbi:MAG: hypothetical protein ACOCYU_07715 [Brevefilum sp.]